MTTKKLIIGTRGSDLALYQANFIQDLLKSEHGCDVEIKILKTAGDILTTLSFEKMEGKGFFTKELEDALLQRQIDLAVHSLKDLMTIQPAGLKLGAAGYRADRRDLLVIRKDSFSGEGLLPIKPGGVVGTSSVRRKCQVALNNDTLEIKDLRGNVPTRINKLSEGQYDAIILAAAGVQRLELDMSAFETVLLDPEAFLPAPAQGILGIQIRDDDPEVDAVISKLGSAAAMAEAELERGLLRKFEEGCSLPLGVHSHLADGQYRLKAILGLRDGDRWTGCKKVDISGDDIAAIVDQAYDQLTSGAQ